MPAVKQKHATTGCGTAPFRLGSDAMSTKSKAGGPFPEVPDGGDANAAHEAELALQMSLAKEVLHKHRKLLSMLADR